MKEITMKKSDVEKLSLILGRNEFKYGKCNHETRIKLVRTQIQVDPIAESVKKAREHTEKKFMSEELKKYLEKYQNGKLEKEDAPRFNELFKTYDEIYAATMLPTLEEKVKVTFAKLSEKEYGGLFDSNADWMSGEIPKFIYLNLVDDSLKDEKEEEKGE